MMPTDDAPRPNETPEQWFRRVSERVMTTPLVEAIMGPRPHSRPSGWVCPKCGSVWAPFIEFCRHCARKEGKE